MPEPIPEHRAFDELETAGGPAWIIDAAAARIVASNAAGVRLLGSATSLDAAMPAITRLRDIARGIEPVIASARPLVFWTPSGTHVLDCLIRPIAAGSGPQAVLVVVTGWRAEVAHRNVDGRPPPMDDAATLREIARRIRDGERDLAAGSGGTPVTPAITIAAVPPGDNAVPEPAPDRDACGDARADTGLSAANDAGERLHDLDAGVVARLAHELKTPLSAIAAAAEIMKDERLGTIGNERYRGYVADIHSGARHALAVIERLLVNGAERTADAASPMCFEAVAVNALAASCVSSMQPLAEKAGLTLTSDLAPGLPPLTADATSLRQILLNLLTNAVKFSRPGDTVHVATRAAAGAFSIEVRDTGPGMTRADIARALDPAGAPAGRTPRAGGGMGLGLPLVRSLTQANAGRLKIDSTPGKGTSIVITFPRNRLIAV